MSWVTGISCLPYMQVLEHYIPLLCYFKKVIWVFLSKYLRLEEHICIQKGWSRGLNPRQLENWVIVFFTVLRVSWAYCIDQKTQILQQLNVKLSPTMVSWRDTYNKHEEVFFILFAQKMIVQNFPHFPGDKTIWCSCSL